MDRFPFPTFFLFLILFILSHNLLFSQENSPAKEQILDDKLECYSIPTEIDGLEYQKSLKCISKDAICYLIQGFAMTCVPRSGQYSPEFPNTKKKPNLGY